MPGVRTVGTGRSRQTRSSRLTSTGRPCVLVNRLTGHPHTIVYQRELADSWRPRPYRTSPLRPKEHIDATPLPIVPAPPAGEPQPPARASERAAMDRTRVRAEVMVPCNVDSERALRTVACHVTMVMLDVGRGARPWTLSRLDVC
jgi:hypothetical protein